MSLATVEIAASGGGTRLIYTEHTAWLDGTDATEGAASREHGVGWHLDNLRRRATRRRVIRRALVVAASLKTDTRSTSDRVMLSPAASIASRHTVALYTNYDVMHRLITRVEDDVGRLQKSRITPYNSPLPTSSNLRRKSTDVRTCLCHHHILTPLPLDPSPARQSRPRWSCRPRGVMLVAVKIVRRSAFTPAAICVRMPLIAAMPLVANADTACSSGERSRARIEAFTDRVATHRSTRAYAPVPPPAIAIPTEMVSTSSAVQPAGAAGNKAP